jgi:hypothetical protein
MLSADSRTVHNVSPSISITTTGSSKGSISRISPMLIVPDHVNFRLQSMLPSYESLLRQTWPISRIATQCSTTYQYAIGTAFVMPNGINHIIVRMPQDICHPIPDRRLSNQKSHCTGHTRPISGIVISLTSSVLTASERTSHSVSV